MALSVSELSVHYGAIEAVRGVSLELRRGAIVALIGPNGAGKSSCANAIVGLVAATGQVERDGAQVLGMKPEQIVRGGLTLVPEGRRIFPHLTVRENILAGALSRPSVDRRQALADTIEMFPQLRDRLKQPAGTLSGGEQQMLAIGRALASRPDTLILDEPSLGLAPQIVDEIFALIGRLKERGVAILLIEQNAERAIEISDTTLVMTGGLIRSRHQSSALSSEDLRDIIFSGNRQ